MGHNHDHDHGDLKRKKLAFSILLNILLTITQVIGGLVSGSLSLLSDALHNFSDVIALIISYIADKLSRKEFTLEQTFGYKRAEIIAALINAASLIAIALLLAKEAIIRFNEPVEIESYLVIILAAFSIIVNGGSVLLLKKDSEENMNMRSAYLHLFSDMLTSVAVLVGGIGMYYMQIFWIDSVLSIVIAIYLVYSSFGLLVKPLRVLLHFVPAHLDLMAIKDAIIQIPSIENIHHIHIWQLNDKEVHFEAHIDLKEDLNLSKVCEITEQIRHLLKDKFHIKHTVLQPEFGVADAKNLVVDER
jgi:cobalt-zinc-cadmium efflux system protein